MDELDEVIVDARKVLNISEDDAIIGDANGLIPVVTRPGYAYIRVPQAGGTYSARKEMLLGPNLIMPTKPGLGVHLGYDKKGERCITSVNTKAFAASGGNPAQLNPLDSSQQYAKQDSLITAACMPNGGMNIKVLGWYFHRNRRLYRHGGATTSLTSFIPVTAGYHRVVGVFILATGMGIEVFGSTPKSQLSPIGEADANECIDQSTMGSTASGYLIIKYGHTTIIKDDTYIDGRGIINVGMGETLRGVRIVTAAGDVDITTADDVVLINKSSGAATVINLPASPVTGEQYTIKDKKGDAASNNITLTPASGNIDGSSTYVIGTNYDKVTVMYNGSEWSVIG